MTVTADLPSSPYAPATVAGILDAAADELLLHGWRRGAAGTTDGPKCAMGALRFVCGADPEVIPYPNYSAYLNATSAVSQETGVVVVARWNDAQRDRRKVVRALRRAARKVRSGEITV